MRDTNNLSLYDRFPNLKSTPSSCLFQAGIFLNHWASVGFFSANFTTRMKLSGINIYPLGNSKMSGGKYFHALKIGKIGLQIR